MTRKKEWVKEPKLFEDLCDGTFYTRYRTPPGFSSAISRSPSESLSSTSDADGVSNEREASEGEGEGKKNDDALRKEGRKREGK